MTRTSSETVGQRVQGPKCPPDGEKVRKREEERKPKKTEEKQKKNGEGRGREGTKTERWKTEDGRMKSVNQIRADVKKKQENKERRVIKKKDPIKSIQKSNSTPSGEFCVKKFSCVSITWH